MRIRYYIVAEILAVSYGLSTIIVGSINMNREDNIRHEAGKSLNDAESQFKTANSNYLANVEKLNSAQKTIADASCYVNQYNTFLVNLNNYCNPATANSNSQSILEQSYGIQISFKRDEEIPSSRQASKLENYQVDEKECSKVAEKDCDKISPSKCATDINGDPIRCVLVTKTKSRIVYYTVYQTTKLLYGALYSGSGAGVQINCGPYTHGLSINSNLFQKSASGMQLIDETHEKETKTFSSQIIITKTIDSVNAKVSDELDSSSSNFGLAANRVLAKIVQECNTFLTSLKNPVYYKNIANTASNSIPVLQNDINSTKIILDAATIYRNEKQRVYNAADSDFNHQAAIWLPIIILPLFLAFLPLIMYLRAKREEKYFDTEVYCTTENCCPAKIANTIPIATAIPEPFLPHFISGRNNRTAEANISDQTNNQPFDLENNRNQYYENLANSTIPNATVLDDAIPPYNPEYLVKNLNTMNNNCEKKILTMV